jgi:hypothetical protein
MKKLFGYLVLAASIFFAASCGGDGANSPAGIEKSIYTQLQKGNYKAAVEILIENLDSDETPSAIEKSQAILALTKKVEQGIEDEGGIKSFETGEAKIADDGLSATVETKIVKNDGSEKTETTKYVNKDGKWKISLNK